MNTAAIGTIGLIIESASGESCADCIENHVFIPLGMNHSHTSKVEAGSESEPSPHNCA
jgi:CubicO group peptidase (beta-lactamase class C family)